MTSINDTLAQRGQRYGSFATQSTHTQAIKRLFKKLMGSKWADLKDDQREALDMIANKLGRITNGDPHYADSWHDIAGYAQLVSERLSSEDGEAKNDNKAEAPVKIEAPAEQAKDDAPCDCPACQLRTVLGAQHVVLIVETDDEDSEDDEQELTAACKKASDALRKLMGPIPASRFTAN